MKSTKKNRLKQVEVANELYEAVNAFSSGHASPESLYVIARGVHIVVRELVENGEIKPNDEFLSVFLDLLNNELVETRTLVINKRLGLQ